VGCIGYIQQTTKITSYAKERENVTHNEQRKERGRRRGREEERKRERERENLLESANNTSK
jgi:hypothetical protein